MVNKMVSVLMALSQAGIRARRGTLNEKAIAPTSPVAVIYPEKSAPDMLTLAVETFGPNAVQCEDTAYETLTVLNSLRGSCTVEKCQYSGKTGLFSVKILVSWPVTLVQRVYINGERLSYLTDLRVEATSQVYRAEDGSSSQSQWVWELTFTELLPENKAPVKNLSGTYTVHVEADGGTEVYTQGCWTSVRRECDSRGILQIRTMQCMNRTIQ